MKRAFWFLVLLLVIECPFASAQVNDDTTAIQEAINSTSGTVVLADGVYRITRTLRIPQTVSISGEGDVILQWAGDEAPMIEIVSETESKRLFGGTLEGIALDGNNTATHGIRGRGLHHWQFNLSIRGVTRVGVELNNNHEALSMFNRIQLQFECDGAVVLLVGGGNENLLDASKIVKAGNNVTLDPRDGTSTAIRCHSAKSTHKGAI